MNYQPITFEELVAAPVIWQNPDSGMAGLGIILPPPPPNPRPGQQIAWEAILPAGQGGAQ